MNLFQSGLVRFHYWSLDIFFMRMKQSMRHTNDTLINYLACAFAAVSLARIPIRRIYPMSYLTYLNPNFISIPHKIKIVDR